MTQREGERERTKWRSGLAWRRGGQYEGGGTGGGEAFIEMPPAFCSAPMEEQLLISGWTWGEAWEQNTHLIRSPTGHQ